MAFQILNTKNEALTIKELNADAAKFWNVEHTEKYVSPKGRDWYENWFQYIGSTISNMPIRRYDWADIIGRLCSIAAIGETNYDSIISCINLYKPYIELCLHWKMQGYTPVSC